MEVRTRFAPSPTGHLHLGNVRTALFNWLFSRHFHGRSVLRMEDTDRKRSSLEFEKAIIGDLNWLGLTYDEGPDKDGDYGPYRQSERIDAYLKYSEKLLEQNRAYRCYCSRERLEELKKSQLKAGRPPRYDKRCRRLKVAPEGANPAIRFEVPGGKISFIDLVHGPMSFDGAAFGDFIIIGADRVATYNFAAAVDDGLMEITHVIRGEDHLSNTPRQILLSGALGFGPPEYMHLPLVLDTDRSPLGKRRCPLSIRNLREEGYPPEAILNALARLGWSFGEGFLTPLEMSGLFDGKGLSKSPAVFDVNILKKFGKTAMEKTPSGIIADSILPSFAGVERERLVKAVDMVKRNSHTSNELADLLSPLMKKPQFTEDALKILKEPHAGTVINALKKALADVTEINGEISAVIMEGIKETGLKGAKLLLPVRAALTGRTTGIELRSILVILGKEEMVKRINESFERTGIAD
ncbi:MAG: glutamate--tRNA ligase [Deltaproteobacteria bacterium]|nr:glutamate--tRNA ligase [Deltaproteobacteria bacterium]